MQKRTHPSSSFRSSTSSADCNSSTVVPVAGILGDAMYADDGEGVEIKVEYNNDETYQDMCLSKFDLDYKLKRSEHQHEFFFAPNENCKSDVWDRFYLIYYRGIKQDYVKCRRCFSILSYKSRTGTASLLRHNCERKHPVPKACYDHQELKHPVIPSIQASKSVADEAKNQIHEGQLYFLAKDLHAFDTTDRVGFQKLAQLLINFGSNFGSQPVNEILAPADYLVNTLMTSTITSISRLIRNFLLDEDVSLSIDISNETCSQRRFLSLTGHIVANDYTLKSFLINTIEIDEPNEIDLKKSILNILDDYIPNSSAKLATCILVLDKETVAYETLSEYEILQSSGHTVQTILDQILANMPDDFRASLNMIKHFVQNVELGSAGSLNLYYTLKYFFEYWHSVGSEKDPNLGNIDIATLRIFYDLLELFEECLTDLRSDDFTTIGKVYLWKIKLKNFCAVIPDSKSEPTILNYLKSEVPSLLDEHLNLNDYHKIALFLNPNFKGLKFLALANKQEIYDLIKSKIISVKQEDEVIFYPNNTSASSTLQQSIKPPPLKRFKDEIIFGEMMDATEGDGDEESPESEIFRYVNYKLKDHCSDVLEYWRMNGDFPNLKRLVRKVLHIPANVESKQSLICQGGNNGGGDVPNSTKSCSCAFKDNIKSLVFLNKNFGLINCV